MKDNGVRARPLALEEASRPAGNASRNGEGATVFQRWSCFAVALASAVALLACSDAALDVAAPLAERAPVSVAIGPGAPASATAATATTRRFLLALDDRERSAATFSFDDSE